MYDCTKLYNAFGTFMNLNERHGKRCLRSDTGKETPDQGNRCQLTEPLDTGAYIQIK